MIEASWINGLIVSVMIADEEDAKRYYKGKRAIILVEEMKWKDEIISKKKG